MSFMLFLRNPTCASCVSADSGVSHRAQSRGTRA
jgi:hypothetical protein